MYEKFFKPRYSNLIQFHNALIICLFFNFYFFKTGDMEVKNPLFLDDPTPPVQKGTIIIKPNQKLPSHLEYSHHEQNLQFRIQECDDGRLNNSETVSEK